MVWRRTKTSRTAWSIIREHMSKCSYGSLVRQYTVRELLEKNVENYRRYGAWTTVNAYFNYMAGAGYIRHSSKHGYWMVVKPIPSDLSSTTLVQQYKDRPQRRGYGYGNLQD